MKALLLTVFLAASFSSYAASVYECDFFGPNYLLSLNDDSSITLHNNFKTYNCEKGVTSFPGTELDLKVLNCASGREKMSFYYADYLENQIILFKNLVLSKDIECNML